MHLVTMQSESNYIFANVVCDRESYATAAKYIFLRGNGAIDADAAMENLLQLINRLLCSHWDAYFSGPTNQNEINVAEGSYFCAQ